jgi:hypothetical protein
LSPTASPLLTLSNSTVGGNGANGFVTITNLSTQEVWNFSTVGRTSFTIASDDLYSIIAAGAQGGNASLLGGVGALIGGSSTFTAGTTMDLLIGGGGEGGGPGGTNIAGSFSPSAAGGGGGTFVFLTGVGQVAGAVPEPATWAMMLLGFGMVAGAARYRRRSVKASLA